LEDFPGKEEKVVGVAKLNIWVSDVADPCGTWAGGGAMTILDCNSVLSWPCGRFLTPEGDWKEVPDGVYSNLPFRCGHLEVEVPPGCYWVLAGSVSDPGPFIHLNYTTHVGIVQVGCDETACVKIYNPTLRLCWDWFLQGLRLSAARGDQGIDPTRVREVENTVEELLGNVRRRPMERLIEGVFEGAPRPE
jgi:hypothetical protein